MFKWLLEHYKRSMLAIDAKASAYISGISAEPYITEVWLGAGRTRLSYQSRTNDAEPTRTRRKRTQMNFPKTGNPKMIKNT
eukprot:3297419-Amphidinium_carterae.1